MNSTKKRRYKLSQEQLDAKTEQSRKNMTSYWVQFEVVPSETDPDEEDWIMRGEDEKLPTRLHAARRNAIAMQFWIHGSPAEFNECGDRVWLRVAKSVRQQLGDIGVNVTNAMCYKVFASAVDAEVEGVAYDANKNYANGGRKSLIEDDSYEEILLVEAFSRGFGATEATAQLNTHRAKDGRTDLVSRSTVQRWKQKNTLAPAQGDEAPQRAGRRRRLQLHVVAGPLRPVYPAAGAVPQQLPRGVAGAAAGPRAQPLSLIHI